MNRVLRPNGILIHATPNAASLRSRVELLSADVPNWFKNFEHIRMWTPKYLSKILLSYNFIRNSLHGSPVSSTLNKKIFSYLFPSLAPIFVESYILRKDE